MSKQVKLALIGAGNRGAGIFGGYALDMPHRAKFTAVVEPDQAKRDAFATRHQISKNRVFSGQKDFFESDIRDIDGVVIATLEDQRIGPIMDSMRKKYHMLVEKPLCTDVHELIRLFNAVEGYEGIIIVCHQMRLAPHYRALKRLIDGRRFGDIVCVQHSENLAYSHMAHPFVRGLFNSSRLTPMLLAKSCHDMDILTHWIGKKAVRVSSFGGLRYFRKENCPKGAPEFCLSGCPHYQSCPYHVLKLYFEPDTDQAYIRQMGVVNDKAHLLELLKTSRFGKCVFQTDNDVVDNQTVQIEFEGGIHVSFTMCGHNGTERRMTKISMTNGELEIDGMGHDIRAHTFEPLAVETVRVNAEGTHGGGDRAIMDNFVDAIESGDRTALLTPIRDSFEGHLLVFAAEHARVSGTVVDLREFEKEVRKAEHGEN